MKIMQRQDAEFPKLAATNASPRTPKGPQTMTTAQRQLLETLAGHIALLKDSHPRKANSATARNAKKYIQSQLRLGGTRARIAA